MLDPGVGFIVGGRLNFNQSFLQFNVKKKAYAKSYFTRTFSIWLEMLY